MSYWRIVGVVALTGCLAPKVAVLQAELDRTGLRMALLEARVTELEGEAGRRVVPIVTGRGASEASSDETAE
ncbi:MAG: hypothetical protein AAF602_19725 [Myxococcota bacterium]